MTFAARRAFFSSFTWWMLVAIASIYYITPLRNKLRFGMDLVGGTFITLEVQVDKAIEAELISDMHAFEAHLKQVHKKLPTSKYVEHNAIVCIFDSMQSAQDAARVAQDMSSDFKIETQENTVQLHYSDIRINAIKNDAVLSNIQVLKTRLNPLSVAEIPVARQGDNNIIIELPDVTNPNQAKEMIGRAAQLEFKLVDREAPSKEDLLYELEGDVPHDKEILCQIDDVTGREHCYLVHKYATITGRHLKEAHQALGGPHGIEPVVAFTLTREGGDKFYELTSKNFGRPLAIVLDNKIISVATIQATLRDSGTITGGFTADRARTLALLLKSGAFVAPVNFIQERAIGPSLGIESIQRALYSCLLGLAILLLFSLFFYKTAGIFAFMSLLYNLLLILTGLVWMKATLTLPGIAGMLLTVGMAIDASILIFEQIKEKLAAGTPLKKAVDEGFSGAMTVILDANITTLIVGIVLYHFGTGPVQGFAVTLMLGIGATLIAGLFFLRSIFNFLINILGMQTIKI
ncbi:MAG TPA: protein translocase subunit SecD [Candidatus Babeliales bacterium]|jgi:preprotein translocase subunit SecD|nr:protein translocase subunit SecD [Candidatus Babeliales bacterium]